MNTPKLTIIVELKDSKQNIISKLRFDKDIKKEIDLTGIKIKKYFSKEIDDLMLEMDDKKLLEYVWKNNVLKARNNV